MVATYKESKKMKGIRAGDEIKISLPLENKYASILRLAVAGIASKVDFSWDKIEDIKMACEEVFLLSLKAKKQSSIDFFFIVTKEDIQIILKKVNFNTNFKKTSEERFSFFILTGLMDDVLVEPQKDGSFNLKMLKKYW
jgi:anti-sigma regulatory factor (Ser/Thr protein kinase)